MIKTINLIVVVLLTTITLNAQVDRSKAPQPGPAPKVLIGEYSKFELPNGLKVFVVENHRIPRVSFSISLIFDPSLEGQNTGIGSLTSQLIGTGTSTRTKDQIDDEIDFISASLQANPAGIFASSLKKHTQKLMEIFSDVTINSSFNKDELEKKRTQALSGLAAEKDDANFISDNVSSALVYGKNYPYGEFETENSIKSITLDMCNQYYKEYFRPNIAYMSVVGDITLAEAKELVNKYFNSWQKAEVKTPTYPKPQPTIITKVAIVDRPQSVQSVVNVVYPIDLNLGAPDYMKTNITNTILGGGVFRLFMNLREKHAYTYGAYSRLSIHPLESSFKASANVRNAVTDSAVMQILYEMKRLRTDSVPESELSLVKNYMTGNFAMSLEKPQTIASFAVNIERYKLPKDFYTNYLKNIQAVTASDVQQMAVKYITPDRSTILVVGKASEIAKKLKHFSPDGKIEYYDYEANLYDPDKLLKPAPTSVDAPSVINKYIEAIGGTANIQKVKDLTMKASLNVQGNKANIMIVYKVPDKYVTDITINGHTVQKTVLNGNTGKSITMQGTRELKGDELDKLKMEAQLIPELQYKKLAYKTELKGIAQVNGKDAYVIEVTSPSGAITTDYYSSETGLKIRSESTEDSPMGKIAQTTDFNEYAEVKGVKYPKALKQTAGSQTFDIMFDSFEVNTNVKDDIFN
jgi:predicted Zn-dependent peptidase